MGDEIRKLVQFTKQRPRSAVAGLGSQRPLSLALLCKSEGLDVVSGPCPQGVQYGAKSLAGLCIDSQPLSASPTREDEASWSQPALRSNLALRFHWTARHHLWSWIAMPPPVNPELRRQVINVYKGR